MTKYECVCCHFSTLLKSNYSAHLLSKKHQSNSQLCKSEVSPNVSPCKSHEDSYACKYCGQKYKHRQCVFKINYKLKIKKINN